MIAIPLTSKSLLNKLYIEEIPLLQLYKDHPNEVNDFFTDVPWFFMEKTELLKLEKENESYKFSDSAKRWNDIKLDIYYRFSRQSGYGQVNLDKSDWEYFAHFNTKQNTKKDLWTHNGPTLYNDDTYWIDKDFKKLFGEYTICDAFKSEPNTIDRLLSFDKNLFFENGDFEKLSSYNSSFRFSNKSLLWNMEKYACYLERRQQETIDSRQEWENMKASEELQNDRASENFNHDSSSREYFNAMTDGQLGNYDDFPGDDDEVSEWSGR